MIILFYGCKINQHDIKKRFEKEIRKVELPGPSAIEIEPHDNLFHEIFGCNLVQPFSNDFIEKEYLYKIFEDDVFDGIEIEIINDNLYFGRTKILKNKNTYKLLDPEFLENTKNLVDNLNVNHGDFEFYFS